MKIAVVGAGVSGLTLAYYLTQVSPENQVTVIESENIGGKIKTERHEDSVLESGPHDIHISSSLLASLCQNIGLPLTPANKDINKKFVLKESQLMHAPSGFEKMSQTPLLFFTEKIKIKKAMKAQYSFWPSMSVHQAFKSVFGQTPADYLSSPLIRYLFHSEAEDIELASAFPDLYEELTKGVSVYEAYQNMLRSQKKWEEEESFHQEAKQNPGTFSIDQGMSEFPEALKNCLKSRGVEFEFCRVQKIRRQGETYFMQSKNKKFPGYDSVIFTIPVPQTARIFRDFDKNMSQLLTEMKEVQTSSIYQAWSKKKFSMTGCGVFCPRIAKMPFLFILFMSNLYPEKSPSDIFLTRTYLSGDHEIFSDSDLAKMSLESLKRNFKIKEEPLWSKVYRSGGFPKYAPGHSEWKEKVFSSLSAHPGLHLHGSAFNGLSVEQVSKASYLLAKQISG